ncbi:MAG: hypothetical protein ACJ8KU_07105, partial [Chthoniobacterales bacterium]
MNGAVATPEFAPPPAKSARRSTARSEKLIRVFFGGNATVAIIVLVLITLFLFREGFGFFGENLANLRVYRAAGLEYVDIIREQADAHAALSRALNDVRVREVRSLIRDGKSLDQINASLSQFDQFAGTFSDAGSDLAGMVSDLGDQASALKEKVAVEGATPRSAIDALRASYPQYEQICARMAAVLSALLSEQPSLSTPQGQHAFEQVKARTREFLSAFPAQAQKLRAWDPTRPVPWYRSITSFLF